MTLKNIVSALILFNISVFTAFAQNSDSVKFQTNEIKVFGNKVSANIFESPSKIQVIDNRQIKNKNGENLSDILQLGGNVFIKSYGGNSSLNTISLNGLGAENTLILVDGFKMNSAQNGLVDLNLISKNNIERIEILNNGLSSVYGSEAVGGVVNIVTKNNFNEDLSLNLNAQLGSYNQRKLLFGIGKNLSGVNFNLNFSKESAENNYDYYFGNGNDEVLKQRKNSQYDISNYSFNASGFLNKNSQLIFNSFYNVNFRNIPGIEAGSESAETNQNDKNWNNLLAYQISFSENSNLRAQLNFQNNLSNYVTPVSSSFYKNIFIAGNSEVSFAGKNNFELTSGCDVSYSALNSNETEPDINRFQSGVYAASQINLNTNVKFFPSLRYDYISDINENNLSGKFGINIKPFEDYNINLKAAAGNNFAFPTFNELYWKDIGNKNLKPEKSYNFDAGIIFSTDFFSRNIIELTYTFINAKNKIVWSPGSNGLWTPDNIGISTSKVFLIDVNMQKTLSEKMNVNLDFSFSFTSAKKMNEDFANDPTFGKQLYYIPEQLAKCNLSINYLNSGINIFYSFTGKRYTDFENRNYLPAADIFEGNIFQNFYFGRTLLNLKLEANNIFNADYEVISGYPMPLRNYKISLSVQY